MPFRALRNGDVVVPAMVPNQEAVECPECRDVMYPRDADGRARHFYHIAAQAEEACTRAGSNESDTHSRCVALAVAALDEKFGHKAADCRAEATIDVTGTATVPDHRRADALLKFEAENPYFGEGLIIEVQHKHHSKDVQGTTHDYLTAGYSVAWLSSDDFGQERLHYNKVNEAFQDGEAYSVREYNPWEFETRESAGLQWENQSTKCRFYDDYGEHAWSRVPSYTHPDGYEYEICRYCGSRRQYDDQLTRFVYDNSGVLAPDVPQETLRDAVILYPDDYTEGADSFEEWVAYKHSDNLEMSLFERALWRVEVAPCRGPHGVHEWREKEILETTYDDRIASSIWDCRHCPVHIRTDFQGKGEGEPFILFGDKPDPEWNLATLWRNPRFCTHYCHGDRSDFDYCPDCGQVDP